MAEVTVVLGSVALLGAGFLVRSALWHRRAARALQRVPVGTARPVRAVRAVRPGDARTEH